MRLGLAVTLFMGACAGPRPEPTLEPTPSAASPSNEATDDGVGGAAPWAAGRLTDTGWTVGVIDGSTQVAGVLDTPSGLLAYGSRGDGIVGPPGPPVAWLRDASGSWAMTRLPVEPRWNVTPAGGAASNTTTVLVGAGATDACAHPFGGTSWASAGDGWVQSPIQPGDCTRIWVGIAPGAAGFVEATAATGEVYGLWHSDDGVRWAEIPAGRSLGREAQLFGIAALPGRYLVVGRGAAGRATAWSSTDAQGWTAITLPGQADATLAVAGAGRIVVVAATAENIAGTWIFPGVSGGPDLASANASLAEGHVTTGTGTADSIVLAGTWHERPTIWVSSDAITWSPLVIDAGSGAVSSVAVSGSRIWVIGWLTDAAGDAHGMAWSRPWPIAGGS